MTNREWIQSTLAGRPTERVPYNFMLSPPARERLENHYGTADITGFLGLPIAMNAPKSPKVFFADPAIHGPTMRDEFGVTWSNTKIDRGSPVGPCLPEPDLSGYQFPDPAATERFMGLDDWGRDHHDNYTVLWVGDLWERATFMRGMVEALEDLILNPVFMHELLDRLTERILSTMEILFRGPAFDAIAVSDDYGVQRSMVMAPDTWRRVIKPCLKTIYAFAHANGRAVFHHSCGHIVPIIPDLIDLGLDILHPIQPEAMDVYDLKRQFGRHLTLCGGLRTQDLLPRGTPEQVRDEVRRLQDDLGRGGRYILEPGITLQADIPPENLVSLVETARS